MHKNRNLLIIALIALVNALGYGIIIPILYSYSLKFGLNDFENGLLFSVFSIFQFLATPIIGRLSDKYGRKPLLLISLIGTATSFFMAAFAPSALFLFIARALDGITAGNIPVASAVISDTTKPEERTKGFGILWGAFGFGFVFGPAISALTVSINPSLPFIIAGLVSIGAVLVTAFLLPETNKHLGEVKKSPFFNFSKLLHAFIDENVGMTFLITLLSSLAFSLFIFAYQPFSVKILHLSANQISLQFTLFGIVGLITQILLLSRFTKKFGLKPTFVGTFFLMSIAFILMFVVRNALLFAFVSIFLGLSNALANPLTQTILSQEVDEKSQGSIMGLNASYMSIGQIFGPILGGILAIFYLPSPFLASAVFALACFFLAFHVLKRGVKKESVF
ncbi:hypothetical protein A3C28_05965 [Candidatus Roizmanbacteria bacterium RIFCSPHIGHO2_02_FULL_39_9]|uniref:Major facilitator superfamily (MFS) profile domain-containing protein n=1 Tax=Candidatus Roizmanbacteria bacterium RIFCSPHIGHO2_02_FULL_39_9 TaxID=1802040 RepID=A0A1F7H821_9BACT|nr:MAG: hypothetical protein A3C28_05965 [Candidatus Roizmanbacteria bacterium RIFCSPHIGHO2_02_FULL_39_9]